jgi:hypothetical protein
LSLKTKVNGLSVVWRQNHWDGLLVVWPQNHWTVFSGLASKPVAAVFCSLASKPVATVSPSLTSKLMLDFLVEPQNQGGGGFPGLGLKIDSNGLVIWTLKSPRRFLGFGIKTKQASVCQLHLKTDGRMRRRGTRVEI